MARKDEFDRSVALPPGLTIGAIQKSIEYIQRELVDLAELYFDQMNVFSAVVGIFGTRALDQHSVYEKVRHTGHAQTRFPDLRHRSRGSKLDPRYCLESKASKRVWAIQSHYDHEGWYIVWRYLVDPTDSIIPGRPVVIWRIDVVYLRKSDWKYEGSKAGLAGGGRTHTFGVVKPSARLKGCHIYQRRDIRLISQKPIHDPSAST